MTLMRLLASGAGVFTPPAPPVLSPYTLNAAPDGAVNPWMIPSAISYSGYTYFGWNDGGSVKIGSFNETTHLVDGIRTIDGVFNNDAHSSPLIHVRASDGQLIVIYSKHNSTPINVKVSSDRTTLTFGGATNLDSQLGGSRYTDEQLWEDSGNLYLFYRDEPSAGTDSRWCISTTSAATPTSGWAAQTIVYRVTSARSYVITALDAANRKLHFIATNGGKTSGGITGFSRLGHFYLDIAAGTYHKSDGTLLSLPLTFASITTAYTGTSGVFPSNVVIDASGYPVVALEDTISGALRYVYLRFNGTTWSSHNVAAVGTGYEYSGFGTGFGSWGSCIDDADPDSIYVLTDSGGYPEVYSYTTADGGATFGSAVAITSGATTPQHQLICVRNASDDFRAYWDFGSWTTYQSFNVGLKGLGF